MSKTHVKKENQNNLIRSKNVTVKIKISKLFSISLSELFQTKQNLF